MKKFLFIALSIFGILLGISACDDTSRESGVEKHLLTFEASGGTQNLRIILRKDPWIFSKLQNIVDSDKYEGGEYIEVSPNNITQEVLADGTKKIHYDWVTLLVARDRKSIQVTTTPNHTGKGRKVRILSGGKIGSGHFYVYQDK